jgi:hypothetical protein
MSTTNPLLFANFSRRFGYQPKGSYLVNVEELDSITALATRQWLQKHQPEPEPAPEPETPKPSARLTPPRQEPLPEQIDIEAELAKDVQKAVHTAEAEARLSQYQREQGLVQDEHNKNIIVNYVNNSTARGYFSREIIDAAIANLRPQLHWKPIVAAAPPPAVATEPAQVLGTLPNGEKQLSLKQPPPKSASVLQLKDYLQRFRAANNMQFLRHGLNSHQRFIR